MTRDKQLLNVSLDQVLEKRRLDQALNTKEFAVLAGISYSSARTWFRQPGFPAFCGVVFWRDFEQWRNAKVGVENPNERTAQQADSFQRGTRGPAVVFEGRAARIAVNGA